jgi:hypothetical protein
MLLVVSIIVIFLAMANKDKLERLFRRLYDGSREKHLREGPERKEDKQG